MREFFWTRMFKLIICMIVIISFSACGNQISNKTDLTNSESVKKVEEKSESTILEPTKKEFKSEYVIGCSQRWGTVPYLKTISQGVRDAAREWGKRVGTNIIVSFTDAGIDNASQQVKDMKDLAASKIDGLLIFPGDSKLVVEPIIETYNKNNIPVVITDIGIDGGDYLSFIITDNIKAGAVAGEVIAKAVPKGGKVAIFDTGPGNNNTQARINGFVNKAKELGLNVLPKKVIKIDIEDGRKQMEETLAEVPDLDGIFVTTSTPAIGAADALENLKNTRCKLVTFDIDANVLQKVKQSIIEACIVQDPYFMGYEGMNQMMYYLTGEKDKIKKFIDSPITVCTKQNASEFENNPQVKLK